MKKLFFALVFTITFLGCGVETVVLTGTDGLDGKSCGITEFDPEFKVEAPNASKSIDVTKGGGIICSDGSFVPFTALIGANGSDGSNGLDGSDGMDGADGKDGKDGVVLTVVPMPVHGACYELIKGKLWAENEGGDKSDLYNNSACAHGPAPKAVICDNLHSKDNSSGAGELCQVDRRIFLLEGSDSSLRMNILDFN